MYNAGSVPSQVYNTLTYHNEISTFRIRMSRPTINRLEYRGECHNPDSVKLLDSKCPNFRRNCIEYSDQTFDMYHSETLGGYLTFVGSNVPTG